MKCRPPHESNRRQISKTFVMLRNFSEGEKIDRIIFDYQKLRSKLRWLPSFCPSHKFLKKAELEDLGSLPENADEQTKKPRRRWIPEPLTPTSDIPIQPRK